MGNTVSQELNQTLHKELKNSLSLPDWIHQQYFSHELAGRLERVTELSALLRLRLKKLSTHTWDDTLIVELILHDTMVGITLLMGILLWGVIHKRNTRAKSIDNLRFHISQIKAAQILQTGLRTQQLLKHRHWSKTHSSVALA